MDTNLETDNGANNLARYTYDNFRVRQPHIDDAGLWRSPDGLYWIQCLGLTDECLTVDGSNLIEWFNHSCKPIGAQIALTSSIPSNSTKIPERQLNEVICQSGFPRSVNEVYYDLHMELPRSFPDFGIFNMPPDVTLIIEREMSDEERVAFESAKERVGFPFELEVAVDPHFLKQKRSKVLSNGLTQSRKHGDLQLITSRSFSQTNASQRLKEEYQGDEDLWLSERIELLTGHDLDKNFLTSAWRKGNYKCLVPSTSFCPEDIRTYLSVNDTVIYQMPLRSSYERFLNSSGLSQDEFCQLFEKGRVQAILPYSIDRYPLSFLERLIEINPKNLLFPRRLACQNLVELRSRVPLLIPPLTFEQRKTILSVLLEAGKSIADKRLLSFITFVVEDLSRIWTQAEYRLSRQGPTSSTSLGLGFIAAELYKICNKRDLTLEFATTAQDVEWSFALQSDLVPIATENYTNVEHAKILLSMYDEMPHQAPHLHDRTKMIAQKILAVGDRVPVLDFVNVLKDGDLARFRKVVLDNVHSGASEEEIQESISKLNKEIKSFDTANRVWSYIDIIGLEIVGAISGIPSGLGIITKILDVAASKATKKYATFGAAMDSLKSIRTLRRSIVPLIARIRKGLGNKRL